jgi:hypothetical protein
LLAVLKVKEDGLIVEGAMSSVKLAVMVPSTAAQ